MIGQIWEWNKSSRWMENTAGCILPFWSSISTAVFGDTFRFNIYWNCSNNHDKLNKFGIQIYLQHMQWFRWIPPSSRDKCDFSHIIRVFDKQLISFKYVYIYIIFSWSLESWKQALKPRTLKKPKHIFFKSSKLRMHSLDMISIIKKFSPIEGGWLCWDFANGCAIEWSNVWRGFER